MTSLTVKMPESLRLKIESEAQISGRSVSTVVREALGSQLADTSLKASLFERTKDLCGRGKSGIKDLASNPKHMNGYGK